MKDFMPKGIKGFQKGHSVPKKMKEKWSRDRMGKISPRKGAVLSQKTKDRISEAYKNMPEEIRIIRSEKLRKAHLGKKQSLDVIKKRVESRKGYKHSQETRNKISTSNRKKVHKTDESKIWRKRIEYKLWRTAIFERDNYICQKCLVRGKKLHPHHIKNFSEEIKLRFAIDNGITFCVKCHINFHKIYGKKGNNKKQVREFINY